MAIETYIMKNRELLDGTNRSIYLVFDDSGEQAGRLTCEPEEAKKWAERRNLEWISPARWYVLERSLE